MQINLWKARRVRHKTSQSLAASQAHARLFVNHSFNALTKSVTICLASPNSIMVF